MQVFLFQNSDLIEVFKGNEVSIGLSLLNHQKQISQIKFD